MVGTGALGRHHVRILAALPGARLVGLHDADPATAAAVAAEHGARAFPDLASLAAQIDAAVVAVPTVDHLAVAGALLDQGLHILVEKPMATSLAEADELLARAGDRVLAVGHVEFYNPVVQALLSLGLPPRFLEVQRLGVFSPRSLDVDVVLDLMIHDLQILHALDSSEVAEVRATGVPVLSDRIDIANARVALTSGCVANLTASRVSGEKVRKLRAFLPSRYYSLDYQGQEMRGYRLETGNGIPGGRRIVPDDLPIDRAEPLRRELEAFVAACQSLPGRPPLVDGRQGRRALATALAVVEAVRVPPGLG